MTHPSLLRETNAFCLFAFFPGGCIVAWRDAFAVPLDCRLVQKSHATDSVDRRRSALMADAQCGDGTAYAVLLRECVPLIRSVAARRVPSDRIDDVVQDTLLTVHRARQTYDPARSFTAWLCTI